MQSDDEEDNYGSRSCLVDDSCAATPSRESTHMAAIRSADAPDSHTENPLDGQACVSAAQALAEDATGSHHAAAVSSTLPGPASDIEGVPAGYGVGDAAALMAMHGMEGTDEAIWQRTRARHPMHGVSLDDLSAMLTPEEEPELFLMEEEDERYQDFLKVATAPSLSLGRGLWAGGIGVWIWAWVCSCACECGFYATAMQA